MELSSREFTKIWITFTTLFSVTEIQENAALSVTGYLKKIKPQFLSNLKCSECVLLKIHEPDNKFGCPCLLNN